MLVSLNISPSHDQACSTVTIYSCRAKLTKRAG